MGGWICHHLRLFPLENTRAQTTLKPRLSLTQSSLKRNGGGHWKHLVRKSGQMRKLWAGCEGGPVPPGGSWCRRRKDRASFRPGSWAWAHCSPCVLNNRKGPETNWPSSPCIIFSLTFMLGVCVCGCWFIVVSPTNQKTSTKSAGFD